LVTKGAVVTIMPTAAPTAMMVPRRRHDIARRHIATAIIATAIIAGTGHAILAAIGDTGAQRQRKA
jgi:uncharacterized membrane protein YhaH (DUF805 family)